MVGSTSIYHATIEVVWRLHQLLKFLICAWCLGRSMKLCYQSNYRWVLALAKFVKWALRHNVESRVWAVVRAFAFYQYGPGLVSWPAVVCGLSLLVLYSVLRGFSLGSLVLRSHLKPRFDVICYDSVWFVVCSTTEAIVLGWIHWDLNKVIIVIINILPITLCPFTTQ